MAIKIPESRAIAMPLFGVSAGNCGGGNCGSGACACSNCNCNCGKCISTGGKADIYDE